MLRLWNYTISFIVSYNENSRNSSSASSHPLNSQTKLGQPHQAQKHLRFFLTTHKDVHTTTVGIEDLQQDFLGTADDMKTRNAYSTDCRCEYNYFLTNVSQTLNVCVICLHLTPKLSKCGKVRITLSVWVY